MYFIRYDPPIFSIVAKAGDTTTTWDLTTYPYGIEAPDHVHVDVYKYDETHHWYYCKVCQRITGKERHTMVGNNGSKVLTSTYYGGNYQESCKCGKKGPLYLLLLGRYENWKDTGKYYMRYTGLIDLKDIAQITYSEYQRLLPSMPVNQQGYTWTDDDGDGLGWVFAGGVIPYSNYCPKGTIELVLGSEGEWGNNNNVLTTKEQKSLAEAFRLAKYISSVGVDAATRQGFVNSLPVASSTHSLYGLKEKYQSISDAKFNTLKQYFKGVSCHGMTWGCTWHCLIYDIYQGPGCEYAGDSYCHNYTYKSYRFESGVATTCDICDKVMNGTEYWTEWDYMYGDAIGVKLKDGQHAFSYEYTLLLSSASNKVGTLQSEWWRSGDKVYRQHHLILMPGCSLVNTTGWTKTGTYTYLGPIDETRVNDNYKMDGYNYTGGFWVQQGDKKRRYDPPMYYACPDYISPVAYGYTGVTQSDANWKVVGNGTESNTSPKAQVYCAFKDPQQYSANTVQVHVYDSDKTTIIKQASGTEWITLTRDGTSDVWRGVFEIMTEVKGDKLIYLQAKDSTGWTSDLIPMQVRWIDSQAPVLQASADKNNDTWSKSKLVTVTGSDLFDNVITGMSVPDMVTISVSPYNYSRVFNMVGDVYEPKLVTFYGLDFTGNLSYKQIWIDKLDNTKPTITDITKDEELHKTTLTINSHDNTALGRAGSGVSAYCVTIAPIEPGLNEFTYTNKIEFTKPGTYYLWARDVAGNISNYKKVEVSILYTLTLDPNEGYLDRSNQIVTRQVYNNSEQPTPAPTRRGYVFLGWKIDYNAEIFTGATYTMPACDVVLTAQWRPAEYYVNYHDMSGTVVKTGKYLYDTEYPVMTDTELKFSKPGNYLEGWATKEEAKQSIFKLPVDEYLTPDIKEVPKFHNLTDKDGDIVNLYAVWRPTPYVVRIYDNYHMENEPSCDNVRPHDTCSYHKDYLAYSGEVFTLPHALWTHSDSVLIGYDLSHSAAAKVTWKPNTRVTNEFNDIYHVWEVYCIWDSIPTIKSPNEINFNYEVARGQGIEIIEGTVNFTQLEAWLLGNITYLHDYEWYRRVGDGRPSNIPIGDSYGYSVRIESFTPDLIDSAAKDSVPLSYTVTFRITDDAGNSATSVTKLFLGDSINILVKTY